MKSNLIVASAVAALFSLGLLSPAQAEMIELFAELTGDGAGSGEFSGTFDTDSREISWVVSYQGLSGPLIGAHIHGPAEPGENAGILVGFEGIENNAFSGAEVLDAAVVDDLLAGRYYANLHTDANPGGEIRGHIMPLDSGMMN